MIHHKILCAGALCISVALFSAAGFAAPTQHPIDWSPVENPLVAISRYMACFSKHAPNEDDVRIGARVLAKHRLAEMVTAKKVSLLEAEDEAATVFNHGYETYQDALSADAPSKGDCSAAFANFIAAQFEAQSAVMRNDIKTQNLDPFPIPARDRRDYAIVTLKKCILYASMSVDEPVRIIASPIDAAKVCDAELGQYRYLDAVKRGVDGKNAEAQATAYYHSTEAISDVESIQHGFR